MRVEIPLFFVLGAVLGSFTNLLIYRLPRKISILNPRRSVCPNCGKVIPWYDNIPILSYIILRGRCRHCGWKIPWRYLIVELLMSSLFALNSAVLDLRESIIASMLVFAVVLLTFVDLEYMIIPDTSFFTILIAGILETIFSGKVVANVLTAAFTFLIFIGVRYVSKKGLGMGDVKLFAVSGLLLGPLNMIFSVFLASISGILVILPAMLKGNLGMRSRIPFGPFIGWSVYCVFILKDWIESLII